MAAQVAAAQFGARDGRTQSIPPMDGLPLDVDGVPVCGAGHPVEEAPGGGAGRRALEVQGERVARAALVQGAPLLAAPRPDDGLPVGRRPGASVHLPPVEVA